MRTYTVLLSVLVHACAVAAAVVVPIVANDELPEARRATAFVLVAPLVPAAPRPPAPVRSRPTVMDAAPVEEPASVQPESPSEPAVDFLPMPGDDVVSGVSIGNAGELPAVTPPPPSPSTAPAPVRVGGAIRPPQRIVQAPPENPAIARASRTTGVVILEAVIAEDGAVRDVRVLRSVPLLDAAAMEAVRKWQFPPTLLNGVPVPVVMTVTVSFTLN